MTSEPAFLLRRLIELAGQERDLLVARDWESALPVQEQFDELFAQLQIATARQGLSATLTNDVHRLTQLHLENLSLAQELQREAGTELANIGRSSQLTGYAPLGRGHKPSPRYLDHSA